MFVIDFFLKTSIYQALDAVIGSVAPGFCFGHGINTTSPALVSGHVNLPNVTSGTVSDRHMADAVTECWFSQLSSLYILRDLLNAYT